jgi:hypothetical protein
MFVALRSIVTRNTVTKAVAGGDLSVDSQDQTHGVVGPPELFKVGSGWLEIIATDRILFDIVAPPAC